MMIVKSNQYNDNYNDLSLANVNGGDVAMKKIVDILLIFQTCSGKFFNLKASFFSCLAWSLVCGSCSFGREFLE